MNDLHLAQYTPYSLRTIYLSFLAAYPTRAEIKRINPVLQWSRQGELTNIPAVVLVEWTA